MNDALDPLWMRKLREACEASSQKAVARKLGISPASLNQVLKGTYKAKTDRIEKRVRGHLLGETVICPVFHEMSKLKCQEYQRKPLGTNNNYQLRIYKACRSGCPHSSLQKVEWKEL